MVAGHCVGRNGCGGVVGTGGRQGNGIGRVVKHTANAAEAIIGEEVEELVFDDWAAHAAAKLLLLMNRLREQERVPWL